MFTDRTNPKIRLIKNRLYRGTEIFNRLADRNLLRFGGSVVDPYQAKGNRWRIRL